MFQHDIDELSFNQITELQEEEEDEDEENEEELKLKQILLKQKGRLSEFEEVDEEEEKRIRVESLKKMQDLNSKYKEIIEQQISQVEEKLRSNETSQRNLRLMTSINAATRPSNSKKYTVSIQKRSASSYFFVDGYGNQPEENIDAKRKRLQTEKMPLTYQTKKWTDEEINSLKHGIHQQNQEILTSKLLTKYQNNTEKDSVEKLQKEIEDISKMSVEELEKDTTNINWNLICEMHVPTRSPISCKQKWEIVLKPGINNDSWTVSEDKLLLKLAKENNGYDWIEIAQKLGTNRNAFQCFKRYQRSLNPHMLKSKWTDEEDAVLIDAVKLYGEKNWQQISTVLDGRTGQQCLHRWSKTLNPTIKRGRWSVDEDNRLRLACHAYQNHNWIKIQQHIPDVQCRERWCNIINPDLKNGPWTKEEDMRLKRAVEELGVGKWSKIAEELYPRTDNQIWRRWKALNADKVDDYKKSLQAKDKVMVKNFVGREKERPEITPDDLKESENELKSRLLSEKYPYSIGLPSSEFVKISLSLVDLMSNPKELNKPEKQQPMFVQPCISMQHSFPCLPATRRNCYALSILNRHLFYPENIFKEITNENITEENYKEEFEEKFDFDKLDSDSFEEIKKKWESTDDAPNFDFDELKYLDIEKLKESKEFSILNSSFMALFSHSLLRVMQTTKQLKPEILEKSTTKKK
eukprot:gene2888-4731_t